MKIGDEIEGTIVHIVNTDQLYIPMAQNKGPTDELYNSMSAYYNSPEGKPVSEVVVGGFYVVQFAQDNEWYRARVDAVTGAKIEVCAGSFYIANKYYCVLLWIL